MLHRPSSRLVSFLVLSLAISPITGHRAMARQVRAAGGPIAPCETGPGRLARLEGVLGVQRRTQAQLARQLADARLGNLDALRNRESADIVRNKVDSWVADQTQMLADAAAAKLTGVSPTRIAEYREKLQDWKDALEKLQKSGSAGLSYGVAIRQNAAALQDFMKVLEFLDESGIGEEAARVLATATFGPAGSKAIDGFNLARDWVLAELQQNISDQQVAELQYAHDRVQEAAMNTNEKIVNLRDLLATCPGAQKPQVQDSPKPIPPQDPPVTGAATTPAAPPAKKSGGNKLGLSIALGMIAAGGGALAISKALSVSSADDFGDGGSGGGGTPTIVDKHEPWVCSGSRCTGRLTIDFPVVMNSGTITVGTNSLFLGQKSVSPTSPAGRVTFDMEKSPYLTCYGTQTTVAIWNSAFTNTGPAAYQLPTSIRIECR